MLHSLVNSFSNLHIPIYSGGLPKPAPIIPALNYQGLGLSLRS